MVVAHKCNNPSCVNPEHLYLTTAAQNSSDAKTDGLYRMGDNHPKIKWKDSEIIKMMELYDEGWSQADIGLKFNTTQSRVSQCIKRARTKVPLLDMR